MITVEFGSDSTPRQRRAVYQIAWKYGYRRCPRNQRPYRIVFHPRPGDVDIRAADFCKAISALPSVNNCSVS